MDEPTTTRLSYRLLKALVVALVIAGVIFLWKFASQRKLPDLEKHRPQLRLLERGHQIRQQRIRTRYEEKIRSAPNEVLSVKYQQEKNDQLDEAQKLYFSDKAEIARGEYGVLKEHWAEELRQLPLFTPDYEKRIGPTPTPR